ncbi:MAG: hypothetical protein OXP08_11550 [bacterium]|nr:hypothetical protein [bacterium]
MPRNAGEKFVATGGGEPVRPARVERSGRRELGQDVGVFEYPEDFNEPLSAGLLGAFEGESAD